MGNLKLEVSGGLPCSPPDSWSLWTRCADTTRAADDPQAFKFALYVAIPIGLTFTVVVNQDVLQAIIKSVSALPGVGSLRPLAMGLAHATHPAPPWPAAEGLRALPTHREYRRQDSGGAHQPWVAGCGSAVAPTCRHPPPLPPPRLLAPAAADRGAEPQVLSVCTVAVVLAAVSVESSSSDTSSARHGVDEPAAQAARRHQAALPGHRRQRLPGAPPRGPAAGQRALRGHRV